MRLQLLTRIRVSLRRKSAEKSARNKEQDDRLSEEFVKCVRYKRRGVVISNSDDQMVSVIMQPRVGAGVSVFRMLTKVYNVLLRQLMILY